MRFMLLATCMAKYCWYLTNADVANDGLFKIYGTVNDFKVIKMKHRICIQNKYIQNSKFVNWNEEKKYQISTDLPSACTLR